MTISEAPPLEPVAPEGEDPKGDTATFSVEADPRPSKVDLGPIPVGARMRYQSPLRYPGAKSGFATVVDEVVKEAVASRRIPPVELFIEPFAGGASTSLRLLGNGTVERALLADADPLVAAFWQVAAADPAGLTARMRDEHDSFIKKGAPAALERWDYWRDWSPRPGQSESAARFETAVRCLFLNRTTFSGILHGNAGPIGGRAQTSQYGIGCRFTPDSLAERIAYVGDLYAAGRIADVWCADWKTTFDRVPSAYKTVAPERVLAYLDPPYLEKSSKLYNKSFDSFAASQDEWEQMKPHHDLAAHLMGRSPYRWILSYDYHPLLLESCFLYGRGRVRPEESVEGEVPARYVSKRLVKLRYSAASNGARSGTDELLITTMPAAGLDSSTHVRPV